MLGILNAVVIHDGTVHPGGAVDVVLEAANALDADLVIGFSGKDTEWWEERAPNDVTVLRQTSKTGTLLDIRTAWSFLNLSIDEYDVVLTSGPSTKFFQPYDDQHHIHYMHHPPLSSLWFSGGLFSYVLKTVDRIETWAIPTVFTNSKLTAKRALTQYGIQIDEVVCPPVSVDSYVYDRERSDRSFVMVGRLEERKRPQVAVEAFRQLSSLPDPPQLHLIGDGPLRDEIEKSAPDNVTVHGFLSESRLKEQLETAYGSVFLARREDFGVTPIEYMAAGLPTVGVDEENTNNQITSGETGVLVEPTADSVASGVREVLSGEWDREMINKRAQSYGIERFHAELREAVEQAQAASNSLPDDHE